MIGTRYVAAYRDLAREATDAGLMRRRYGFYWTLFLAWTFAAVVILAGVVWLGDTWFQLILAALFGLVMSRFGFLAHETAHQAVFVSTRWNEWAARVVAGLLTGLSYGWWMDKHNTHHANPNKEGVDPDAAPGVLSFTPDGTAGRTGVTARMGRYQGWYFLPLLFFEGFSLHVDAFKTIFTGGTGRHRRVEAAFIAVRMLGYLIFLFAVLPPFMAAAFAAVQIAVFGFLLGGAFSPNHIGMPTVPHDVEIDFLRRQVCMSRNVYGGWFVHFFMGGLEYQIEHHLFPRAPRPNLPALRQVVRRCCAGYGIPYTERSLWGAYATVLAYLNQVGWQRPDPYVCPLVRRYRG